MTVCYPRNMCTVINNLRKRADIAFKQLLELFVDNRNARELLAIFALDELAIQRNVFCQKWYLLSGMTYIMFVRIGLVTLGQEHLPVFGHDSFRS